MVWGWRSSTRQTLCLLRLIGAAAVKITYPRSGLLAVPQMMVFTESREKVVVSASLYPVGVVVKVVKRSGSVDIPDTVLISRVDKKRLTVFSDGAGGTMAEVGLLPFARVALEVATQVLPPYRTRFSKHQFTQPQLLAVLCLMRYEHWNLRATQPPFREQQAVL